MKNILLISCFFITFLAIAQTDSEIDLKKSYVKISTGDSIKLIFPSHKTIELDSFIIKIDSSHLNFLKDFSLLDNNYLVTRYKWHAFRHYKNRNITQIIGPITIFIDKEFPENIKLKFIEFVEDIPEIKNLKIKFTNDFEEANYFIDILQEDVTSFTKDDLEYLSETDIEEMTFSKMTYKFYSNNDHKLLSCHFKISKSIINDTLFLTKLKKGFFRSLGQFFESKYAPKSSLLYNKPNIENEFVTDYDIMILKLHYENLYRFKVNSKVFDELIQMRKKLF